MAKKKNAPKQYWEGAPTPKRVAAFANESSAVHLVVLSVLRFNASDAIGMYFAASAVGFAIVATGIATLIDISPLLTSSTDYVTVFGWTELESATFLFAVGLGFLTLALLVTALVGAHTATRIRKSRVLLDAYETELERRFAARGLRARRWQREHRPNWDG